MHTIMICDACYFFRQGVSTFLNSMPMVSLEAEANSGEELLDILSKRTVPDTILMDIFLPDMNGYDLLKILRANFGKIKVVVVANYASELIKTNVEHLGAFCLVPKSIEPDYLRVVLEHIIQGQSKSFIENNKLKTSNKITPIVDRLTTREMELAEWMSTSLPYKHIAKNMCISVNTLANIRERLFKKTGIQCRSEIVSLMFQLGLIKI